jgi:hypothetical protein
MAAGYEADLDDDLSTDTEKDRLFIKRLEAVRKGSTTLQTLVFSSQITSTNYHSSISFLSCIRRTTILGEGEACYACNKNIIIIIMVINLKR